MTVGERARDVWRHLSTRRPLTYLLAGWLVFMLGAYPGYLSIDGILQLYTVRSGDYSDYAPIMTALWGALEYVAAGPFPMLVLQSGLFLFGLYGILAKLVSPRAAAVTAGAVMLFPPVFAPMAVIWPESLMAGALLATLGAAVQGKRGWSIAAVGFAIIACGCRFECVFALTPIAFRAIDPGPRWKRAGVAIGLVAGVFASAKLADYALTVVETYTWQQELMVMDTVGTLRRAKVRDSGTLETALAGLPIADRTKLVERMKSSVDALDWYPVANGPKRVLDRIDSEEESDALSRAWRGALTGHTKAYLVHRWTMIRSLFGLYGKWTPVYDEFGDVDLLAPLHHRATASDWQYGMQQIVRAFEYTPLFRPVVYFVLALVALWFVRKRPLLRSLAISGLVLQVTMFFFAPANDYRYSHWLVTTTCIVIAALAVLRQWAAPEAGEENAS
ncbi:MAG: hypothetical protein ACKV2T_20260 [Kofleriaceae bacterium]